MGKRVITVALFVFAAMLSTAQSARAEYLCDVKYENCRTKVLTLIRSENVGIDWTFWITEDSRYATELIKRFQAGVPVRIIMDLRANLVSPINEQTLNQLKAAGIPIRYRSVGDVAHMKMMLFAGQNWVEFSGANYNPFEYVPAVPWVNYQQESIYFTDDPSIVNSFRTRMDNVWTNNAQYTDWANVANPKTRQYPTYPIDPELNFPPEDSYTSRLLPLMDAEPGSGAIQVFMFRLTDSRPVDAVIRAFTRGVDTRLIVDEAEYRNPARLDDSYNVDRMYKAGVPLRFPAHQGVNHQKSVVLSAQRTAILSSSNWSVASDDNQLEGNIFTKKSWFVQWFEDQFETAWANLHVMPDGTQAQETKPFKPLPPTKPIYNSPANAATGVGMSTTLKWNGGYWARIYDVYLGTTYPPSLFKANLNLGPSASSTSYKSLAVSGLAPGTTYYWKVVSKTMADLTATGTTWSFTTSGTPPGGGTCTDPNASNYGGPLPCTYPPPGGGACSSVTLDKTSFLSGAGTPGATSAADWIINVTAPSSTCTWTATSDESWLVVKSTVPSPPVGSGYVKVRTLVNTGPRRIGHFVVGGVTYTVTQGAGG